MDALLAYGDADSDEDDNSDQIEQPLSSMVPNPVDCSLLEDDQKRPMLTTNISAIENLASSKGEQLNTAPSKTVEIFESKTLDLLYPQSPVQNVEQDKKFRFNLLQVINDQTDITRVITSSREFGNPEALQWVVDYFGIDDRGTHFPPSIYNPQGFEESETYSKLEAFSKRFVASDPSRFKRQLPSSSSDPTITNKTSSGLKSSTTAPLPPRIESNGEQGNGRWGAALEAAKVAMKISQQHSSKPSSQSHQSYENKRIRT